MKFNILAKVIYSPTQMRSMLLCHVFYQKLISSLSAASQYSSFILLM
jgi:hypothetical protein